MHRSRPVAGRNIKTPGAPENPAVEPSRQPSGDATPVSALQVDRRSGPLTPYSERASGSCRLRVVKILFDGMSITYGATGESLGGV